MIQRDKLVVALDAQLEQAIQDDKSFSVIACVAQALPDENFDEILSIAEVCLRASLREDDRSGRLDRSTIIMGLPGTTLHEAKSLASRLTGDFSRRASHLQPTSWRTGITTFPDDGVRVQALIEAAIEAAQDARMNYSRKGLKPAWQPTLPSAPSTPSQD
jgi:GGDEF domain-containing protein